MNEINKVCVAKTPILPRRAQEHPQHWTERERECCFKTTRTTCSRSFKARPRQPWLPTPQNHGKLRNQEKKTKQHSQTLRTLERTGSSSNRRSSVSTAHVPPRSIHQVVGMVSSKPTDDAVRTKCLSGLSQSSASSTPDDVTPCLVTGWLPPACARMCVWGGGACRCEWAILQGIHYGTAALPGSWRGKNADVTSGNLCTHGPHASRQ